jgi:catechol 2,3-dioxygenase-like lactoylglutathione lyase family enzyme
MSYRLEHVAILCKNLKDSIAFYQKLFGGEPTPIRKGAAGYGFCFLKVNGEAPIQLMESDGGVGVHHYGFVTDDVEAVARDFQTKGVTILRENRDAAGKLTTIFCQDPNGLQIEVRTPR